MDKIIVVSSYNVMLSRNKSESNTATYITEMKLT
jgi:hypothetical protein